MKRDQMIAQLKRENPYAKAAQLHIYADALVEYRAAQEQIEKHGVVLISGGKPCENPYVKIRNQAAKTLMAANLRTTLWEK